MRIEIEFLGTGTSTGVPTIGCDCSVCTSHNPRNKRLRSSVLFRISDDESQKTILVDVTPDIRMQALRSGFTRVDSVLITHTHADHCHGLDDMRALYWAGGRKPLELWSSQESLDDLKRTFGYIFDMDYDYKGVVRFDPHLFTDDPFTAAGIEVTPIPVIHGNMIVAGFRIGDAAYITDTNKVPDESIEKLKGVKLLVLDALRRAPHPTHMSLPAALETAEKIGCDRVWFTHINHDLDHELISAELPEWASLGHDMLRMVLDHDGSIHAIEPNRDDRPPILAL